MEKPFSQNQNPYWEEYTRIKNTINESVQSEQTETDAEEVYDNFFEDSFEQELDEEHFFTEFSEQDIEIAEMFLEILSEDPKTMSILEAYLTQDRFHEAGIILEASMTEGFDDLAKKYLSKTDTKASATRDLKRGFMDMFKKPSMSTKIKRAVGDEIEDTAGSIKRLFAKKGENKDGIFFKKKDKDEWDSFQRAKDFKQVGKAAAVAAGVGLAAWGAYKGGKALYGKLKNAISQWKSGTSQKDPKKVAAAAQTMATVIKKAPPKVGATLGAKIAAPAVAAKVKAKGGSGKPSSKSADKPSKSDTGSSVSKSSSSSSKSGGSGNPDNWGGKRKGAGRPEGS